MNPSGLDIYLEEIGRYDLLTREEELSLGRRTQDGDIEARNMLVTHNLRLVVYFAKKYVRGNNIMDLIQEGNLGLMKAVEKYDPGRGLRFSTYASFWIRQAMQRTFATDSMIRLPENVEAEIRKMKKLVQEIEQVMGRELALVEIMSEANVTEDRFMEILPYWHGVASLDAPREMVDGEDGALHEVLPAEDTDMQADLDTDLAWQGIEKYMGQLPERERYVVQRRFGLGSFFPHTLHEIGLELSISKERVRQIEIRAVERMKEWSQAITVFRDGKARTQSAV